MNPSFHFYVFFPDECQTKSFEKKNIHATFSILKICTTKNFFKQLNYSKRIINYSTKPILVLSIAICIIISVKLDKI